MNSKTQRFPAARWARSRSSRRFAAGGLVFALLYTVFAGLLYWNDTQGAGTSAVVLGPATPYRGGKPVSQDLLTVRYVTDDGRTCESAVAFDRAPGTAHARSGDGMRVHYARYLPCKLVRPAETSPSAAGHVLTGALLLLVFSGYTYIAWRPA